MQISNMFTASLYPLPIFFPQCVDRMLKNNLSCKAPTQSQSKEQCMVSITSVATRCALVSAPSGVII